MKVESLTNYNQFFEAVQMLGKCTDDYIFLCDLSRDVYTISESAVKKFNLPASTFPNTLRVLSSCIHPDDFMSVVKDFNEINSGQKDVHDMEYRWLDNMGNTVWISCRGRKIKGKNGNPDIMVGRITELGGQRKADNTTGFLDISVLRQKIKENTPKDGYIMRVFIKNMYEVTVKVGVKESDTLIQLIANAIRECLKDEECYYYGGGMFTIFSCKSGDGEDEALKLYKKISDTAACFNEKMGYQYVFRLRGGVLTADKYGENTAEILKQCEFSSTFATTLSSKNFYIYNADDYNDYLYGREVLSAMQIAVQEDFRGFELYYQPVVNAKTKKLYGCEALLRYHDDKLGRISPGVFIPLLEQSGLIIPVGRWVLNEAVKQCRKWQEFYPEMHINVNLSYIQLEREEVLEEIVEIITGNGMNNNNLILEFTESGNLINNVLKDYIHIFRNDNIKLALDDFGTGYSNLLYLSELQVDVLKIDRTFVETANHSDYCYTLIKYITDLAHSINIKVCFEGIENENELERMSKLSPDYFQGFYFSRPIPAVEFEKKYFAE